MLGLYGWEGVNPIPPELFLLPECAAHPPATAIYCHTRYIYLGIAYLYGRRFTAELGAARRRARRELYDAPYDEHRFRRAPPRRRRRPICTSAPTRPLRARLRRARRCTRSARSRGCGSARSTTALERIVYELRPRASSASRRSTACSTASPLFDAQSRATPSSLPALRRRRGLALGGRGRGRALRRRALHAVGHGVRPARAARRAGRRADGGAPIRRGYALAGGRADAGGAARPRARAPRADRSAAGASPTGMHRWPVSDCTAEALAAILRGARRPASSPSASASPTTRLLQAVRFILGRQNDDGGFGTYERRRGSVLLEALNPSEMYGNCMTERSYARVHRVAASARWRGSARRRSRRCSPTSSTRAIARGVKLLRARAARRRRVGGFWGVNFTYGIFHAVEGLLAAGAPRRRSGARARGRAGCARKQKPDGGWGEHYAQLPHRQLRRAPREPGGDDELGAAGAAGRRGRRTRRGARGVAFLRAAAAARRQRSRSRRSPACSSGRRCSTIACTRTSSPRGRWHVTRG